SRPGKLVSRQSDGGHRSKHGGNRHGNTRHDQAVAQRREQCFIFKQLLIPLQRKTGPRNTDIRTVEAVCNDDEDRRVEKDINDRGDQSQPHQPRASAASFSSRICIFLSGVPSPRWAATTTPFLYVSTASASLPIFSNASPSATYATVWLGLCA